MDFGRRAARRRAQLRVELRSTAQAWYASPFGCMRQWRLPHGCAARNAARNVKLPFELVCVQVDLIDLSPRPRDRHLIAACATPCRWVT